MFGVPWMVADHYVVSEDWRPYFRPEDSSLLTLRVWIRLPGIPLEYFDYSILKRSGDRIGKTVRVDHTTLEGSRGNFARLCVEVDLSKPLLSKYRLRRRVRRIEYEGLHTICLNFVGVMAMRKLRVRRRPRRWILTLWRPLSPTRCTMATLWVRIVLRLRKTLDHG
ncbi:hypothetical protein LINPERPRIM_LOCUS28163 [Linum perenne]